MKINELIYLQNPWFRDQNFIPREYFWPKRRIFQTFFNEIIKLRQIISVTGLRRTGKSTLLKQAIAQMIYESIKSNKILYFSFEQPTIAEIPQTLEEIIHFYFEKIIKQPIHRLTSQVYIFLDEIQLVPFWQDILKRYYDINQNIKFVVSGSTSLFISEKSKESLAGRIFERSLPPLCFSEYKKLAKKEDFIDYLNFGQFPELLKIEDNTRKIDYLKEGMIGKILEVDIVKTYGIRKTVDFERLFWSLLPNTGQIIQSGKLMADLQMKKATLFKYLSILEKSLLINKVLNLSGSFRSEKRLLRKLYPASTNFLSLLPEPINIGFKVENYIALILKDKARSLFLYNRRGREIDFILPEEKLAIEVKYQGKVRPSDYKFLSGFVKEKKYHGM
ncbi:MAG: ATP-binding protein, partial [Candidatus Nealsonbacteria bacterium]|nr:ATP-binding protein [Candidatus Nealsonbacteria bacterium]